MIVMACDAASSFHPSAVWLAMADEVLILDVAIDGAPYIGPSTARELNWALALGRRVRYWSQEQGGQ